MCLLAGTFCFVFWEDSKGGWRPSFGRGIQRGRRSLWPEESKETGGFVAEDPTGKASPWHTALHEVRQRRTSESDCLQSPSEAIKRRSRLMAGNAKYSVLYLCGGDRRRMPAGRAADAVCGMGADCFSAAKGTCPDNHRRRGIPFPLSPFAFHRLHTMRKSVL